MLAQHMTYVLTQKTFNTLPKFLYAVNVFLVHPPVHAGARLKWRNLAIDGIVPGDVRHQILDYGERLHGEDRDGLVMRKRIQPRLAGKARTAVHFGRAGTALAGLAVPAHGQVGRLMALDIMQSVEDDHAGRDRHPIFHRVSALARSTKNPEDRFCHGQAPAPFSSASNRCRSSGIAGTGSCRSVMVLPWRAIMLFRFPHAGSGPG